MHLLLNYNVSGYVQSVFKLYQRGGGLGGLPHKIFTELGTELGNSRHF